MADRVCDNCMNRVDKDAEKCPKCGIRFENTNPGGALPNGWVLAERYTVGRYIDLDGEGVTYSAIDGNTLQRVVIKEFMPVTLCANRDAEGSIIPKPGCEVLFKTTRMDFSELFGTLLRLGLSEGLAQVLDVLEENNTAYAVLEKIEGPTLAEYLTKMNAPVDANRALTILRPVLIGVETLHSANIIHRGISPENIILESGGTAKLAGFATLALRQQGSELKAKLYSGYSAPEQYVASEFEGRYTDIYSIGAVLYRMVTGEVPYGADERRMQDNLRAARTINKEVPAFLSAAISRSMRLLPAERMQTIADFRLGLSGEATSTAQGLFGLSKKQLIIGASALGSIVVLLLIITLVAILGGKKNNTSSSSLESSSLVSSVPEGRLPNFVGKEYEEVIENEEYKEKYKFGKPEFKFDNKMPEGKIISQKPLAGKEWDGKTPIIFVVSKGSELVIIPDLTKKTEAQAVEELKKLNADLKYTIVEYTNDGDYEKGTVVKTDPVAGTEVSVANTNVILYIAKDVASVKMPNLKGLTRDQAINKLKELKIQYNEPLLEANDGRYVPGEVIGTDKMPDSNINISSDKVTLYVANDVSMPNVVGKTLDEAQAILDALKSTNSKVSVSIFVQKEQSSTVGEGKVIKTNKDGGTIKSGEQIVITIAEAVPEPPKPDSKPEDTSNG